MQRECKSFLNDILEAIRKIEKYAGKLSFNDFVGNELIQDGVIRNLEIIGEAGKNIPNEIKTENPEIEWNKITGLRNILIHEYFGIDVEIVWDIVINKIPEWKKKILLILCEIEK